MIELYVQKVCPSIVELLLSRWRHNQQLVALQVFQLLAECPCRRVAHERTEATQQLHNQNAQWVIGQLGP